MEEEHDIYPPKIKKYGQIYKPSTGITEYTNENYYIYQNGRQESHTLYTNSNWDLTNEENYSQRGVYEGNPYTSNYDGRERENFENYGNSKVNGYSTDVHDTLPESTEIYDHGYNSHISRESAPPWIQMLSPDPSKPQNGNRSSFRLPTRIDLKEPVFPVPKDSDSDVSSEQATPRRITKTRLIIFITICVILIAGVSAVSIILTRLSETDKYSYYESSIKLALDQNYTADLGNKESDAFKNFSKEFCLSVQDAFVSDYSSYKGSYQGCIVDQLSEGSIVVQFRIIFSIVTTTSINNDTVSAILVQGLANGSSFAVITISVQVSVSNIQGSSDPLLQVNMFVYVQVLSEQTTTEITSTQLTTTTNMTETTANYSDTTEAIPTTLAEDTTQTTEPITTTSAETTQTTEPITITSATETSQTTEEMTTSVAETTQTTGDMTTSAAETTQTTEDMTTSVAETTQTTEEMTSSAAETTQTMEEMTTSAAETTQTTEEMTTSAVEITQTTEPITTTSATGTTQTTKSMTPTSAAETSQTTKFIATSATETTQSTEAMTTTSVQETSQTTDEISTAAEVTTLLTTTVTTHLTTEDMSTTTEGQISSITPEETTQTIGNLSTTTELPAPSSSTTATTLAVRSGSSTTDVQTSSTTTIATTITSERTTETGNTTILVVTATTSEAIVEESTSFSTSSTVQSLQTTTEAQTSHHSNETIAVSSSTAQNTEWLTTETTVTALSTEASTGTSPVTTTETTMSTISHSTKDMSTTIEVPTLSSTTIETTSSTMGNLTTKAEVPTSSEGMTTTPEVLTTSTPEDTTTTPGVLTTSSPGDTTTTSDVMTTSTPVEMTTTPEVVTSSTPGDTTTTPEVLTTSTPEEMSTTPEVVTSSTPGDTPTTPEVLTTSSSGDTTTTPEITTTSTPEEITTSFDLMASSTGGDTTTTPEITTTSTPEEMTTTSDLMVSSTGEDTTTTPEIMTISTPEEMTTTPEVLPTSTPEDTATTSDALTTFTLEEITTTPEALTSSTPGDTTTTTEVSTSIPLNLTTTTEVLSSTSEITTLTISATTSEALVKRSTTFSTSTTVQGIPTTTDVQTSLHSEEPTTVSSSIASNTEDLTTATSMSNITTGVSTDTTTETTSVTSTETTTDTTTGNTSITTDRQTNDTTEIMSTTTEESLSGSTYAFTATQNDTTTETISSMTATTNDTATSTVSTVTNESMISTTEVLSTTTPLEETTSMATSDPMVTAVSMNTYSQRAPVGGIGSFVCTVYNTNMSGSVVKIKRQLNDTTIATINSSGIFIAPGQENKFSAEVSQNGGDIETRFNITSITCGDEGTFVCCLEKDNATWQSPAFELSVYADPSNVELTVNADLVDNFARAGEEYYHICKGIIGYPSNTSYLGVRLKKSSGDGEFVYSEATTKESDKNTNNSIFQWTVKISENETLYVVSDVITDTCALTQEIKFLLWIESSWNNGIIECFIQEWNDQQNVSVSKEINLIPGNYCTGEGNKKKYHPDGCNKWVTCYDDYPYGSSCSDTTMCYDIHNGRDYCENCDQVFCEPEPTTTPMPTTTQYSAAYVTCTDTEASINDSSAVIRCNVTSEAFTNINITHLSQGSSQEVWVASVSFNGDVVMNAGIDDLVTFNMANNPKKLNVEVRNIDCTDRGQYIFRTLGAANYSSQSVEFRVKASPGAVTQTVNADLVEGAARAGDRYNHICKGDIGYPAGRAYVGIRLTKSGGGEQFIYSEETTSASDIDKSNPTSWTVSIFGTGTLYIAGDATSGTCTLTQEIKYLLQLNSTWDGGTMECFVHNRQSNTDTAVSADIALIPANYCTGETNDAKKTHPGGCNKWVVCYNGSPYGWACTDLSLCYNIDKNYCESCDQVTCSS